MSRTMYKKIGICMGCMLCALAAVLVIYQGKAATAQTQDQINTSGRLENGFRVLTVKSGTRFEFVVYRGDYVKFDVGSNIKSPILSIPALSVEKTLTPGLVLAPYVKMKEVGVFDFFIGTISGTIQVKEYSGGHYQAVSARKAREVIHLFNPLILDVRTPREYAGGHLENSILIPVQQLQRRLGELSQYQDEPILVYCATGNRSTVASKILVDSGFTRIFNLRRGIADWYGNKYPVK